MNETQFKYFLDDLATSEDISQHCKNIRAIFFSQSADLEKLERTILYLSAKNELDQDTFSFLKRGIRGTYGNEGMTMSVSSEEEADFWLRLHQLFPEHGKLTLVAADANLTSTSADEAIYGPLFIKALQQIGNVYEVGGEIGALLLDSKYRFEYQLLFLEQVLKEQDEYPEDAQQEINELLGEYPFEAERIKLIQILVEKYKINI